LKKIDEIRKNQRQVDINGLQLDLNRPDLQFNFTDEDNLKFHVNVEFDRDPIRALEHEIRIRDNDPASIILLFPIGN